jgi:hypothetical protein
MNQKCVTQITSVKDTLAEVVDGLEQLQVGVETEDEDKIDHAMDLFPTPRVLERALSKLGNLISSRPWERKTR